MSALRPAMAAAVPACSSWSAIGARSRSTAAMASSCRLGNVLAAFAGAGRAAQSSAAHSSTGVLPLRRPLRRAMSSAQGGSVFSDMEAWKAGRSDPAKRKARLRPTTEVEAEVAAQRADERERRMAHATGGKVEAEEAPGSARVFVYNMPYSWDEETMRRRVRRAAKVKAVQVLRGRDGRSKGAGLVEFADGVDPHVAAQRLDGLRSGGRTLGAKVDTQRLYYVALEGLHQQVRWFDVKDLMRVFGRVDHVYFDARSTAIATFRYHKPAVEAICTLNNSPIFGRNITARAHVGDDGVEADWFEELTDKARVARSVLVSGLPENFNARDVREMFDVVADTARVERFPPDIAVVRFETRRSARDAVTLLDGHQYDDRHVLRCLPLGFTVGSESTPEE